jgi:hypothetical protein
MGLGAFAGGLASGIRNGMDIYAEKQRLDMAKQEEEMRKQAADREQTRFQHEEDQRQREEQFRKDMADNVDAVFGKATPGQPAVPAQPEQTQTLTGPLDAMDARAGTMDGVQTTVTNPAQPAQAAIPPSGGMNGIDLTAPENQKKLVQLQALNFQSQMKNGLVKPEDVQKYAEYGKKLEEQGLTKAFGKFLMGDNSALDEVAAKNGVKSYSLAFKNVDGMPQSVVQIDRGDQGVTEIPTMVFAAAMSANGMIPGLDKQSDNETAAFKAKALGDYYKVSGAAATSNAETNARRADIYGDRVDNQNVNENRRTDSTVSLQGAQAQSALDRGRAALTRANKTGATAATGYDPKLVGDLVSKAAPVLPSIVKRSPLDKSGNRDVWAQSAITDLANDDYRNGRDPTESVAAARRTLNNINTALAQSGRTFKNADELNAARQEMLDKAREQIKAQRAKQKPASAPNPQSAFPRVSAQEQQARDVDRYAILRQEREKVQQQLNSLPTTASQEDRHRIEMDLQAIDRELQGAANKASALRRKS